MLQQALQENVNSQNVRLEQFSRLLDRMLREAFAGGESTLQNTLLFASVLRARQAAKAVYLLSQAGCVEEVLAIGRTLLEVTINGAYLQHAEGREVQRYLQFHPEASYAQGLLRSGNGRGLTSGLMRKLSGLVVRGGSGGSGRDGDPAWSARSILDRAQLADEASNIPVMSLLVKRCYPRGHAAVHGTIGSLEVFVSAIASMEPPRVENRLAALTEAVFGVNLCLLTLCIYLNSYFKLGLDGAIEEAAGATSTEPAAARRGLDQSSS